MNAAPTSSNELRRVLSCFATGVTVVTTCSEHGTPVGLTVNSFSSVSLTPPLVLWSLRSQSRALACFKASGHFAVNILSDAQRDASTTFAGSEKRGFESVPYDEGLGRVPVLRGCLATLECRIEDIREVGDHAVLIGLVLRHAIDADGPPLIFFRGRYIEAASAAG